MIEAVCSRCKKNAPAPFRKCCARCLEDSRIRSARPDIKARRAARPDATRTTRRKAGICRDCGKVETGGPIRCEHCARHNNAMARARYAKSGAEGRRKARVYARKYRKTEAFKSWFDKPESRARRNELQRIHRARKKAEKAGLPPVVDKSKLNSFIYGRR